MATNFPTSLDTFTNPNSGNTLDSPSHSVQHSDINDAVEAIEAKIGVGSSTAGSATAGYALVNTSGGTTAYSLLGVSGLSSGTAVANTVLTANGSGGATFAPTAQGLTLLNTVSFSAQSSVSLPDNTFTSTYTNYYLIVQLSSASTNTSLRFRMRAAGSDDTGGNYAVAGLSTRSDSATIGSSRDAIGLTSWYAGDYNSARPSTWFMDVTNPNVATQTLTNVRTITNDTSNTLFNYYHGGLHSQATAYDSMTIFPTTGTITGTYYIYGVNK